MVTIPYRSSFGDIDTSNHNGEDALRLSRTHCENALEDTLAEFTRPAGRRKRFGEHGGRVPRPE
jgi:hypothetical protein